MHHIIIIPLLSILIYNFSGCIVICYYHHLVNGHCQIKGCSVALRCYFISSYVLVFPLLDVFVHLVMFIVFLFDALVHLCFVIFNFHLIQFYLFI